MPLYYVLLVDWFAWKLFEKITS